MLTSDVNFHSRNPYQACSHETCSPIRLFTVLYHTIPTIHHRFLPSQDEAKRQKRFFDGPAPTFEVGKTSTPAAQALSQEITVAGPVVGATTTDSSGQPVVSTGPPPTAPRIPTNTRPGGSSTQWGVQ
eukprot:COSAG01_NODE_40958_length_457_cov_1.527933_1_plen_127_part_10